MLVELTVASHAMHENLFFFKECMYDPLTGLIYLGHYVKVNLPGHHWKSSHAPESLHDRGKSLHWH